MRDWEWKSDPKHLLFALSRYKFVAKMLSGLDRVAEIGAEQGDLSELVRREVGELVVTDLHPFPGVVQHDILESPLIGFDAVYSLDVLEHIKPQDTEWFLRNMKLSLRPKGICIIGSPSLRSWEFATEKKAHINCLAPQDLKIEMLKHFDPVFMFGMNDEVVHTGFDAMRHYNLAIGIA